VTTALTQALAQTAARESAANPYTVIGILASALAALGFLIALYMTARRTRRVINIGLSLGLLAVVGAIVIVGVYTETSAQIIAQGTGIVASAFWYVVSLGALCFVAVVGTLVGMHARIKEYL
jgi:multisubunit Na+/H+ antiporter MnhC subunit